MPLALTWGAPLLAFMLLGWYGLASVIQAKRELRVRTAFSFIFAWKAAVELEGTVSAEVRCKRALPAAYCSVHCDVRNLNGGLTRALVLLRAAVVTIRHGRGIRAVKRDVVHGSNDLPQRRFSCVAPVHITRRMTAVHCTQQLLPA
jgi:hypothetical protein